MPAAAAAAQLGPAPLIDAHVTPSRKVKVRTTDRRPGGLLEVDISWAGRGPYSGKIYGSVQDLEADGYCVGAWVFTGAKYDASITGARSACPAGSAIPAYYSYKTKWRVLVQVCLVKHNRLYDCSRWS